MVLVLILVAVLDIKRKIIEQKLLMVLIFGSIAAVCVNNRINLFNSLAAMLLIFLILSSIYFISHKGIGWGDVKLCTCVAPYLGVDRAFTMILIAILSCAAIAIVLITVNKTNKNREVPFAPFVAVGTIVALLL
jgi:leader peptidase (prepilin peptidase) / N-methyltransferase